MTSEREIAQNCACLKVRMAARAVTRAYDLALKPVDLKVTQFSLLVAASARGPVSITALAEMLGMDRTTLTRNLGPLTRRGLVELGPEGYRRTRDVTITPQGRAVLKQAIPRWESVQEELRRKLGREKWTGLYVGLDELIAMA
ncbi:MAG TPA: MarR family winged helix-turn-helix transcriptional regulator [Alphaproteobacteria bacterium]